MKHIHIVTIRYYSDGSRDRGTSEHFFRTEDEAIRFTDANKHPGMLPTWRSVLMGSYPKDRKRKKGIRSATR